MVLPYKLHPLFCNPTGGRIYVRISTYVVLYGTGVRFSELLYVN